MCSYYVYVRMREFIKLCIYLRHTVLDYRCITAKHFYVFTCTNKQTNEETPVKILGDAVLALLTQLLAAVDEKLVISACHILKVRTYVCLCITLLLLLL